MESNKSVTSKNIMQASLARNRKNSHYPDYDPNSNFNSRGQTQNSVVESLQSSKYFTSYNMKVVLHDHLDSPDSGIVRDAYGVPVPATYSQVDQVKMSLLLLRILISSRLNWRSL